MNSSRPAARSHAPAFQSPLVGSYFMNRAAMSWGGQEVPAFQSPLVGSYFMNAQPAGPSRAELLVSIPFSRVILHEPPEISPSMIAPQWPMFQSPLVGSYFMNPCGSNPYRPRGGCRRVSIPFSRVILHEPGC